MGPTNLHEPEGFLQDSRVQDLQRTQPLLVAGRVAGHQDFHAEPHSGGKMKRTKNNPPSLICSIFVFSFFENVLFLNLVFHCHHCRVYELIQIEFPV